MIKSMINIMKVKAEKQLFIRIIIIIFILTIASIVKELYHYLTDNEYINSYVNFGEFKTGEICGSPLHRLNRAVLAKTAVLVLAACCATESGWRILIDYMYVKLATG